MVGDGVFDLPRATDIVSAHGGATAAVALLPPIIIVEHLANIQQHLLPIYETRMAMPPLKGIYKIRNVRRRHHAALKNREGDLVACEDCGDGDAEIVSSIRE